MKLNFTLLASLLLVSVCIYVSNVDAQTQNLTEIENRLTNPENIELAKQTIDDAKNSSDSNLLFTAMRNPSIDVQLYCLTASASLSPASQAKLLARILRDESIVHYDDGLYVSNAAIRMTQDKLQEQLQRNIVNLLKDRNIQPKLGLTGIEARNLAKKLDAVR